MTDQPSDLDRLIAESMSDPAFARAWIAAQERERTAVAESHRRLNDPDWRLDMPLRWRISRWWSLWWPVVACYAALSTIVLVGLVLLWPEP